MGQDLDGASSFHPYHILLIWTTSCTTSLFVYLKLFKELAFKSCVENGCKGKSYFRNHQIFQKVFSEKFFSGGPKRVSLRAYPFSLPCSMQGKILGAAPPERHPAYTLSSEFHFFSAFPSRKRLQRYRLFRNLQAFLETFLKHFLELIHKYLINKRIKFNNFQDSESKGQRMTPYKFRARAYIGKQKRTHVSIQTNGRFH